MGSRHKPGSVRTLRRVDGRFKRRILSKEQSVRSGRAGDSDPAFAGRVWVLRKRPSTFAVQGLSVPQDPEDSEPEAPGALRGLRGAGHPVCTDTCPHTKRPMHTHPDMHRRCPRTPWAWR